MRRLLLLVALSLPLTAEILDRVAITVEQQVITELQIDEEIRVTAFLNRQPATLTLEDRRAAADRLIQQYLVGREMKLGHYPSPTAEEVDQYLSGLRETFGGPAAFASALEQAHVRLEPLRTHLSLQLTTLRFIEYRFRPNFEISDEDIQAYRKRAAKPVSRESAREILIQQRTDQILETWLEESRKQVNILYLDQSLQ